MAKPVGQPELTVTQLLDSIDVESGFSLLSAKVLVSYATEKKSQSFGVRARMKRDSIIWLSITPALGIEMARLTITPDTIKMLNRLEKKYFIESYDNAKQLFGVDVDFGVLQSVLSGGFVQLYKDEDYHAIKLPGLYVIEADTVAGSMEHRSEIDPATWKLTRSLLYNPVRDEHILAEYTDFVQLTNIVFPAKMHFRIQGKENVAVDLGWSKMEEKSTLNFPFNIPKKYVPYGDKEKEMRNRRAAKDERHGMREVKRENRKGERVERREIRDAEHSKPLEPGQKGGNDETGKEDKETGK